MKKGESKKMKKYLPTERLTKIALFTAIIAILSQISIPLPFSPVPLTGQTLGIFLAGSMLGSKAGVLSVCAYLLLGAAGAPVFALGRGGLQVILGPTGGYLLGLIPGTYFLGKLIGERENTNKYYMAAAMGLCLAVVYTLGGLQLGYIMELSTWQALSIGVLPYIPGDIIKIVLAIPLISRLQGIIKNNIVPSPFA